MEKSVYVVWKVGHVVKVYRYTVSDRNFGPPRARHSISRMPSAPNFLLLWLLPNNASAATKLLSEVRASEILKQAQISEASRSVASLSPSSSGCVAVFYALLC